MDDFSDPLGSSRSSQAPTAQTKTPHSLGIPIEWKLLINPNSFIKSTWLCRWLGSALLSVLLGALLMISVFPDQVEAALPTVVVEQLRLRVPSDALQAWLEAERGSWEPWLAQQPGFMGRQLFWDPQQQEGILLIYWASRQQWQATSSEEQQQVQQRFELLARAGTGEEQGNPFPLIFSGELLALDNAPEAKVTPPTSAPPGAGVPTGPGGG